MRFDRPRSDIRKRSRTSRSNLLSLLYSYSGFDLGQLEIFGDSGIWSEALASFPERGYKTPGNLATGMSASKRDAGARTRKRRLGFLRGEWIDPTARSTLTATHSPGTSQPRDILRLYIATLLLIANRKYDGIIGTVTRESITFVQIARYRRIKSNNIFVERYLKRYR